MIEMGDYCDLIQFTPQAEGNSNYKQRSGEMSDN